VIKTRVENNEVLYSDVAIPYLHQHDIVKLKNLADQNPRKRVRLCTHRSPNDNSHEMFIVHMKDCYVRPHKHLGKAESVTVLEGEVDVVLFNDNGRLLDVIHMSDPSGGKSFYYRMSDPIFHSLLIKSKYLVFHEVTTGPFTKKDTVFPDWAPQEDDKKAVDKFINNIQKKVNKSAKSVKGKSFES